MPRRALALFCAGALLQLLGAAGSDVPRAAASSPAPPKMIGLAPQTVLFDDDLALMEQAGVSRLRLLLRWSAVQPVPPHLRDPDWRGFDRVLGLAATNGFQVLPFLWGSPEWVARDQRVEPTFSPEARRGWARFLRDAAARYGPDGSFWDENPDIPRRPIRAWQIWNEPNLISFSRRPEPRRYARLVRISARAIRSVDGQARIIAAGLFGRVLRSPPNVRPVAFLREALDGTGLRRVIDAVALHPYVPQARRMVSRLVAMRRVLREAGRPRLPLWITEMGWGSDYEESIWERGWTGQAHQLNSAMRLLVDNRRRWRVRRIYWFSWIDAPICHFCDSAGLFTEDGRAKPAWYAFNAWTGGDPRLP